MLSRQKITALCSEERERKMAVGERAALHAHLMMCSGCSNFRRQLNVLHGAMRTYADGKAATCTDDAERGADPRLAGP